MQGTMTGAGAERRARRRVSRRSAELLERLGLADRYRIDGRIGRGGMATVYRAFDLRLDRPVALKVVSLDRWDGELLGPRFSREARVLASLRHKSLPCVFELGQDGGLLFMAYELIEGVDLASAIDQGLAMPLRIRALRDVARALDHAHRHGVLHRDVKPANIIVNRHRACLVDFGLAKGLDHDSHHLTRAGEIFGTPAFMAPEQIQPGPFGEIGPHTDVRGLGATLYQCLTGRPPYDSALPAFTVLTQIVTDPAPSARAVDPDVPKALDAICRKAMARGLTRRIQTAAQFAELLDAWLARWREKKLASAGSGSRRVAVRVRPKRRTTRRHAVELPPALVQTERNPTPASPVLAEPPPEREVAAPEPLRGPSGRPRHRGTWGGLVLAALAAAGGLAVAAAAL